MMWGWLLVFGEKQEERRGREDHAEVQRKALLAQGGES
jgi:hypothetical protein